MHMGGLEQDSFKKSKDALKVGEQGKWMRDPKTDRLVSAEEWEKERQEKLDNPNQKRDELH
jgi:hypothetical protein